jgi:hypothetical protein
MNIVVALVLNFLVTPVAAEALPVEKRGQCPAGYVHSGGYCAPMAGTRRDAVPKVGRCPTNWVQSGNYCLSPSRR